MRVRAVLVVATLAGCGGDLLPGERILGEEVPAVVVEGQVGEGYGAAVAVGVVDGATAVFVAAVDAGRVDQLDARGVVQRSWSREPGFGQDLAVVGGHAYALDPGTGIRRLDTGELALEDPDARRFAVCDSGAIWTRDGDQESIACGPGGEILALHCDSGTSCKVKLDGTLIDIVDAGGAVAFDGDRACWGDVMSDHANRDGRSACRPDIEGYGLEGEHLGASMVSGEEGEALVAGVFDKWIVPARARIHVMGGGEVWAVDDADENARLALGRGAGLVVVGVAGYRRGTEVEGRVFIVDVAAAAAGQP